MRTSIVVLGAIVWIATAACLCAKPGLNGPTGLVFMPTSAIPAKRTLDFGVTYLAMDRDGDDWSVLSIRALAQVLPRLEAGVLFIEGEDAYDPDPVMTLKYQFRRAKPKDPVYAFGVIAPTDSDDYKGWYIVGETKAADDVKLHFGVGGNTGGTRGHWAAFGGRDAHNDADELFLLGGLELKLNRLRAYVETDGDRQAAGFTYGQGKKGPDVTLYLIRRSDWERSMNVKTRYLGLGASWRF